jgi:hypothetical protein
MRRGHLARFCLIVLIAGGCGQSAPKEAVAPQLIDDVEAGSVAIDKIASINRTVREGLQLDPSSTDALTKLYEGRLDELTQDDVDQMDAVNRASLARLNRTLSRVEVVTRELRASRIDVGRHSAVSKGGRRFLRAWNAHLEGQGRRMSMLRDALEDFRPVVTGFSDLLDAALDTARLDETRTFMRARDRYLADIDAYDARLTSAIRRINADTAGRERLIDALRASGDARALVRAVTRRDPHGYLARVAFTGSR